MGQVILVLIINKRSLLLLGLRGRCDRAKALDGERAKMVGTS